MMKRHIAIPLLCVVLVAALSIPVFATSLSEIDSPTFPYPENNVTGFGSISFTLVNAAVSDPLTGSYWINFGEMWIAKFSDDIMDPNYVNYGVSATLSFSLTVNVVGSFYIARATNSDYIFSSIEAYRDPSLDYTVNFTDWPVTVYEPSPAAGGFTETVDSPETVPEVSITFVGYTDVPIGNYSLETSFMTNYDFVLSFGVYASGYGSGGSGGSGGTDTDDSGGSGDTGGSGSTGNSGYEGFNNIVDKFQNGNITYTDALDQLGDRYDFIHTTDIYQNLLYVNEYQMSVSKLNGLVSSSAAEKSSDLDVQMSATVEQFADGSINLKDAMDTLSSDYSSSLSGAQTVEEADALTAVYQVKLLQLENESRIKIMDGFDTVITDEQIQNAHDYYAAESELVNAFDLADLEAQFQYELWWNQMPRNETIEYKKFFDYLLNESDIRFFITIPLALSLVTIIMGTRMRTKPDSDSDPNFSHVWLSDGSAYHHKD